VTTTVRIATFNLENLDDVLHARPTLAERIAVLRPALIRLRADVLCLQEVHSQQTADEPRTLRALDQLLDGTSYEKFIRASTMTGNQPYHERNLVTLSRFPITESTQYLHDLVPPPSYQQVTRQPRQDAAQQVRWERPILYTQLALPDGQNLHLTNIHLKSRLPSTIEGQKTDPSSQFSLWRTAAGWAEGFFLSSIKRVGQALEVRTLVDTLFDAEPEALIAVCGDFNADDQEVPMLAIAGNVEDTQNPALGNRILVSCERSVAEPARFTLYHHGRPEMIDHVLASRQLLAHYRGTEIHNEILHDESVAFASDARYPESDHAPVVAEFQLS